MRPIVLPISSYRSISTGIVETLYPGIRHALSSTTGAFIVGMLWGACASREEADTHLHALESLLSIKAVDRQPFDGFTSQATAARRAFEYLIAQGFIDATQAELARCKG